MTDSTTHDPSLDPAAAIPCPICAQPAARRAAADQVACLNCGEIEVAAPAAALLARHPALRPKASRLVRQAPWAGGRLFVTVHLLHEMFPAELGPVDG